MQEIACDLRMICETGVFFFQAEDGIRDHCVTGVQTCALPIYDIKGSNLHFHGVYAFSIVIDE